jgi:hypothetical protein
MEGIEITYKTSKKNSSRFSQKLFGRISKVTRGDKVYRFYEPGILDDKPFQKLMDGKIFVQTTERLDLSPVIRYCDEIFVSSVCKEHDALKPVTGEDKWDLYAKEHGWILNGKKSKH